MLPVVDAPAVERRIPQDPHHLLIPAPTALITGTRAGRSGEIPPQVSFWLTWQRRGPDVVCRQTSRHWLLGVNWRTGDCHSYCGPSVDQKHRHPDFLLNLIEKKNNSFIMSRHRCFHVTPVDRSQLCEFIKETIILFGDFSIHNASAILFILDVYVHAPLPPVIPKRKQKSLK